ncbi:pro-neuregulin-4, membrane-bound isoform isoform X8 [Empidonax traillii]|uniref:pro-neuregulin-4, membrane-bound isoform isoform X8 n=1 Tax=Empidonax traillii TaxID=164674 RepID=UPI000FFD6A49|nr:pro-neuregulin-4, membrane-bound isoform isoform X8 [Empidonax traillii]
MTQGAHKGGTRNLETHLEGQTGSQVPKGLSGAFLREKVAKNHEELCGTSYGSFCLNGGICYMIPTVSSPFCRNNNSIKQSSGGMVGEQHAEQP